MVEAWSIAARTAKHSDIVASRIRKSIRKAALDPGRKQARAIK